MLMAHVKAGDEVVCGAAIYGGTLHLLHDLLRSFGVIAAVRVARGAGAARRGSSAERTQAGLVRVADQPDAALRRHPTRSPTPAARAACCR